MNMIVKIVILVLITTNILSSEEGKTKITAINVSENLISIVYEGPKMKFSASKDQDGNIIIELMDCLVDTSKKYSSRSGLVKDIKVIRTKDRSRLKIEVSQNVDYSIFEGEKVLGLKLTKGEVPLNENLKIIPPKKISDAKDVSRSSDVFDMLPKYRIDLEYRDTDVRTVILQMMQRANINVIFDDDVAGSISLSLKGVSFDKAFKTILNMKGLVAQSISENLIKISTPKRVLTEQKDSVLKTKVFFLNYVKASDLKSQIESIAQAEGRTTSKCNVDDTNNALIVTDTVYGLDEVERLIKKLDRMPKQVIIEAKLVEVSLDSGLHTGVQWGVVYTRPTTQIGMGNSENVVRDLAGNPLFSLPIYGGGAGTGVSLPPEQIYGSFRFLKVTSKTVLDATLSAAVKKGKANILSNPKIATLNNKEASINIINQIPYVTTEITNTSGGSVATQKVTYITAGIVLNVLPTITSDGKIIMKISPKVSKPSQTAQFQPPSIDERRADTTVVVDDGETIAIGGLIHESESEYLYKVPVLGDIPVLGYLFKKKSKEKNRMELLIFVTPKILE